MAAISRLLLRLFLRVHALEEAEALLEVEDALEDVLVLDFAVEVEDFLLLVVVVIAHDFGSARMQEQALVTPIAEAIPSAVKGEEL